MSENRFVVCLLNEGYPASLEPRKLYEWLDNPQAESKGMLRIIDESGEDYLYPKAFFARSLFRGGWRSGCTNWRREFWGRHVYRTSVDTDTWLSGIGAICLFVNGTGKASASTYFGG